MTRSHLSVRCPTRHFDNVTTVAVGVDGWTLDYCTKSGQHHTAGTHRQLRGASTSAPLVIII